MTEKNFKEWYEKVIEACRHHDSDIAYSALRVWDEMIVSAPASVKDELMRLKEKLLFTSFPSLPLNQAVDVVAKQFLNLIGSEVDADEVIQNRFQYLGYGNQEEDRKALRGAVLRNNQKIGGKTVAEWAQVFDQTFPPEGREENAVTVFFTQIPTIGAMSKTEQTFLHKFLQIYDQWFASPLVTIYDTSAVYKKLVELEEAGVKEINPRTFEAQYMSLPGSVRNNERFDSGPREKASPQQITSLSLLPALSKFENLGNQLITQERIKVKSQQEPVRPSLLYWLKCYRDELGIGQHDSVEIGQFLFRSENGKNLSSEERERVNLLLKSIEENLPLLIDTERQEIIFPDHSSSSNVLGGPTSIGMQSDANRPINIASPVSSSSGDMSFSAGHIFPAEKESSQTREGEREITSHQRGVSIMPAPSFPPTFEPGGMEKAFDGSHPFITDEE